MAGVRATDQDRDKVVEAIEEAYAKGQLDDAERELRTQRALQATTLPDLSALVSDLQPRLNLLTPKGTSNVVPVLLSLVAVSVAVAVVGIVVGLIAGNASEFDLGDSLPPTSSPFPSFVTPRPAVTEVKGSLLSEEGFTGLVDEVKAKFGSALVDDAVVYPEYASFTVPLESNKRHTQRWTYRNGFIGTPTQGNRRPDDPLIDLDKVDVKALMKAIQQSKTALGVEDVSSTYLIFDERNDQPAMSVYVSNDFRDTGYISLALDGKVLYTYKFQ
ncbi:DUF1707 SHOCT-like domain-containing protein [Aeromicrobium sp.]